MYGTVAHVKVKPGKVDDFIAFSRDFADQRRPKGYIGEYIYQMDKNPNELIMAVLFQDKESYLANAQDPEMDKQYRQYREFLEADPVWHDGEVIYSFQGS